MKVTVEFEPNADGSRRVEESKDFLLFWRDVEGKVSWTDTGWTEREIIEAMGVARERLTKEPTL